jgi:hypothetical protein
MYEFSANLKLSHSDSSLLKWPKTGMILAESGGDAGSRTPVLREQPWLDRPLPATDRQASPPSFLGEGKYKNGHRVHARCPLLRIPSKAFHTLLGFPPAQGMKPSLNVSSIVPTFGGAWAYLNISLNYDKTSAKLILFYHLTTPLF